MDIEEKNVAEGALSNLPHYQLSEVNINVEANSNSKTSTKLLMGNISPTYTNKELQAKVQEYYLVIGYDIMKKVCLCMHTASRGYSIGHQGP